MGRSEDLERFYRLMVDLESRVDGKRRLGNCDGYMDWPDRGVYFFFASDERRANRDSLRVTRIGTHAVSRGSGTSLWNRLRSHRGALSGTYEGGGNHRGSVFRKAVGEALLNREDLNDEYPDWGVGNSAGREQRLEELELEKWVSEYIRELPFLWVNIEDEPGPASDRAFVERNAIALASNYDSDPIDPRSDDWLGAHSPSRKVHRSGLWNVDYVDESYDPAFLERLAAAIEVTTPP